MNPSIKINGLPVAASSRAARILYRRWFQNMTLSGTALALIIMLIALSPFRSLRIPVGGLLMHPYLILLGPAFALLAIPKISRFPQRTLSALGAFIFLYALATALGSEQAPDEIMKIVASGLTIVTSALLVRTRDDFRVAAVILVLVAMVLALQNLFWGTLFSEEATAVANKNAYSVYVLPPLLLAGYLIYDAGISKLMRILMVVCMFIMILASVLSGNRSGWLGAFFVLLMFYGRGRRLRATIVLCVLCLSTYYVATNYFVTTTIERRIQQTVGENTSDDARIQYFLTSLEIAYENPLLGVSPQGLTLDLARRLPYHAVWAGRRLIIDPHNVFAQVLAGAGILTFAALCYFGWALWRRQSPPRPVRTAKGWLPIGAHATLRMLILLWIMRGLFTGEVLYSPSFNVAFGLLIGLCIMEGVWQPPLNLRQELQAMLRRQYQNNPRLAGQNLPPRRRLAGRA